jgi:hypothetical protein
MVSPLVAMSTDCRGIKSIGEFFYEELRGLVRDWCSTHFEKWVANFFLKEVLPYYRKVLTHGRKVLYGMAKRC